jgi:integrase
LRQAKSLFAPGAIKHLSLSLPSPLPFEGIAFEPRQSMRYRSHIDPAKLAQAAQKELATDDPPAFLAFLLALGAGLRRIEIDRLEWAAFRFRDNVIRIEPTRYFDVKTEHSIGDVQVDPELMAVFRAYFAQAGSNFVIEGAVPPIPEASWEHYRAPGRLEWLSAWLRGHGVTARKPIHELRKEFGSMVNRKHGLSAVKICSGTAISGLPPPYYIDSRRKATSGLGGLLEIKRGKGKKIVEFKAGRDTGEPSSAKRRATLEEEC